MKKKIISNWAWAAGLFDGEGHISTRDRTGNGHNPKYRSPRSIILTINQHDEQVLDRFNEVTGNIMGKYHFTKTRPPQSKLTGTYDSWGIRTGKRDSILYIIENMWPWLGDVKRLQAALAIDKHSNLDPKGLHKTPEYIVQYLETRTRKKTSGKRRL